MLFDVCKFTVHKYVHKVANTICSMANNFIRWPNQAAAIQQQSHLPRCISIIDGTHIHIVNAPGSDPDYFNRKSYPSIQLQLAVDDLGFITLAFCGWPGATHDSLVLRNSELYRIAETAGDNLFHLPNSYIMGDSGYPLRNWLMTPFIGKV